MASKAIVSLIFSRLSTKFDFIYPDLNKIKRKRFGFFILREYFFYSLNFSEIV